MSGTNTIALAEAAAQRVTTIVVLLAQIGFRPTEAHRAKLTALSSRELSALGQMLGLVAESGAGAAMRSLLAAMALDAIQPLEGEPQ